MSEPNAPWRLMIDSASRGNRVRPGCGAAICDKSGTVVKEISRYLGRATHNVAEYEGLLIGLEPLIEPIERTSLCKVIRNLGLAS